MDKIRRPHKERTIERIRASGIVSRLIKHVKGEVELSSTQVQAAKILLAKALPDLKAVEHSGEIGSKTAQELTREELLVIAAGSSEGDSEAGRCEAEPASVH